MYRVVIAVFILESFYLLAHTMSDYREIDSLSTNERLLEIHRKSLLAPFVELVYASRTEIDLCYYANIDDKIDLFERIQSMYPNPKVSYGLVELYRMKGWNEKAVTQQMRAEKIFPSVK
jgi:hypothetical protein